ncbi:MAG: hypothetical protein JWN76_441 [Chitinophagaceae bacterium]|nr:hypothetical protein [Chitinophagaceae bacterium]
MKKIVTILALAGVVFTSCTKDFETVNTDPNNTPNALPQQLLAPALVNTMTYNMIRNRNFNNELMQVSVDISDAEGKVFRYDYRSGFSDYLYNGWYSQLVNFRDIYNISKPGVSFNTSYQGISLICQSWIYSLLTDTYGDVPFTKALLARDSAVYEAPFDRQKDIYMGIFQALDSANLLLKNNTGIVASSDPVYNGNIALWRKFGNSLYLRLLMRISGKAEVAAFCKQKIKDIVETNASTYPIMTSNAESAVLRWTGAAPYTSPLMTVREQDFRAPGIGDFFISNLVNWSDPVIDIPTYGTNGINRWAIAPYQGAFKGVVSGYSPGAGVTKYSYFYSTTSTSTLMTEPLAGMIMNYSELQFILAEAHVKGFITTGTAQGYYENGVKSRITLWLPGWNDNLALFLSNASMQYGNGSVSMAWDNNASLDLKMERIHLQKYYALFLTDLQQWFEYRRTGHPNLPKGPGLANNGIMPARMAYPVYVQSTNPTNYKNAIAVQGPDVISTQVWWQKP